MRKVNDTSVAALTALILEVFRINGALLTDGDKLVAGLGLTSARWQVLGAIDASAAALSVAQIARNMGLTRQAVQRVANEMAASGYLRFEPNPHHARAQLVVMTDSGKEAFKAAMALQRKWAAQLAHGLSRDDIVTATALLAALRVRLEK